MIRYTDELEEKDLIKVFSDYLIQSREVTQAELSGLRVDGVVAMSYQRMNRDNPRLGSASASPESNHMWRAFTTEGESPAWVSSRLERSLDIAYLRSQFQLLYPDGLDFPD